MKRINLIKLISSTDPAAIAKILETHSRSDNTQNKKLRDTTSHILLSLQRTKLLSYTTSHILLPITTIVTTHKTSYIYYLPYTTPHILLPARGSP